MKQSLCGLSSMLLIVGQKHTKQFATASESVLLCFVTGATPAWLQVDDTVKSAVWPQQLGDIESAADDLICLLNEENVNLD